MAWVSPGFWRELNGDDRLHIIGLRARKAMNGNSPRRGELRRVNRLYKVTALASWGTERWCIPECRFLYGHIGCRDQITDDGQQDADFMAQIFHVLGMLGTSH